MGSPTDLPTLLAALQPVLDGGPFVFVSLPGASYGDGVAYEPVAAIHEAEGLTLILSQARAEAAALAFEGTFHRITLQVHSSLAAIGLSAAVAGALAEKGISANIVAAYHHDQVFVPEERAEEALAVLVALSKSAQARLSRPPTA